VIQLSHGCSEGRGGAMLACAPRTKAKGAAGQQELLGKILHGDARNNGRA